jgi:PAS domain S-box-containing protein
VEPGGRAPVRLDRGGDGGHSIRRLLPRRPAGRGGPILARIRAGERVGQFFTKRLHKDGRLLDVSVTVSPVRDARARSSARARSPAMPALPREPAALRESEERFRMLADNISQIAWIASPDGQIVWFNKRWYEYTGCAPEDAADDGAARSLPEEHMRAGAGAFPPLGRERRGVGGYLSAARQGLDRPLVPLARDADPRRAGEITWWFGTNTDITEQREQADRSACC